MALKRRTKDWISSYLELTKNTEPPRLYHEWIAVSAIASVLERKTSLELGTLKLYPNFYIVLVGPPGKCRKGTAMGIAEGMLRGIGVNLAKEAMTRQALINLLSESTNMEAPTDDGTLEMHSSLTVFSKELTVFLGYNNQQLMADLCDWFDCGPTWTYETVSRSRQEILNVWVNLLGATTPDLIRSTLPTDAIGGGLASRIIFVYEDNRNFVPYPMVTDEQAEIYKHLVYDLEAIHVMRGQFKFTQAWLDAYVEWRTKEEYNPSMSDPNFEAYIERRPTHILKLCMIMCASRSDKMVVDVQDLERAIDLLNRTEIKMPRTFAGFGRSRQSEVLAKIMTFIGNKENTTDKELLTTFYSDLDFPQRKTLDDIIQTLEAIGFIRTALNEKGLTTITKRKKSKIARAYMSGDGQSDPSSKIKLGNSTQDPQNE